MDVFEYTPDQLSALLPWPASDAHKYARGKLTVVAGAAVYPGAACLAAFAAQRTGAGYVEVVCAPESVDVVRGFRPSLVVRSWDGWDASRAAQSAHAERPAACAVGPGFDSSDARCARLALEVVRKVGAPVLVDGGALTALATRDGLAVAQERACLKNSWLENGACRRISSPKTPTTTQLQPKNAYNGPIQATNRARDAAVAQERALSAAPLVLTPHGGEAARLARAAGIDADALDAPELAARLARAFGAVVALKGPDTFVSDGEATYAMRQGTPALAKAGTGDVLAGMVGALLAQGLAPLDAAVLGATLHAEAGRAAAAKLTDICVTPEDVIEAIPQAVRAL